ncbi:MAG: hypothetical protein ACRETB_00400 [Steroidobacteraceae bacterium]
MPIRKSTTMAVLALTALMGLGASRADAQVGHLKCTLTFTMKGWSIFYHRASGEGTVRCADGASMRVHLRAEGGGLTVGKSVESGFGQFSEVSSIHDLLGSYAVAQAHAGAVNSAQGEVMTKGPVSLALSAKGHGWELGVSFGEFKIEP